MQVIENMEGYGIYCYQFSDLESNRKSWKSSMLFGKQKKAKKDKKQEISQKQPLYTNMNFMHYYAGKYIK